MREAGYETDLDSDTVLQDSLGSVKGDLVIRLVTVLQPEVVVLDVDVEEGEDELRLDLVPDNPRHLVSIELGKSGVSPSSSLGSTGWAHLDDGVDDLDLLVLYDSHGV